MNIQRNAGLAWREVGDETIVIHLGRKMMYGLNPAGGRVWAAIGQGAALAELRAAIPVEAGSEENVGDAVEAFLAELACEGLIEVHPPDEALSVREGGLPDGPWIPRIAWQEEVRRFAGGCALYPGTSNYCNQAPSNS